MKVFKGFERDRMKKIERDWYELMEYEDGMERIIDMENEEMKERI